MVSARVRVVRVVGACALAASAAAGASDIGASGTWAPALRGSDLAGAPIRSAIESAAGQVVLAISNAGAASWEVTVRNDGTALPAGVQMSVRVSAVGSGAGAVSGGSAYVRLDGSTQVLLSGTGERSGVQLQFRLDGTSVRNAVGHYSTTIIYSLR